MKAIESSDINKYRTRKQMIHMGWCHLKDGLVLLLSLGSYRSGYSTDASTNLLLNASNMRKAERKLEEAYKKALYPDDWGYDAKACADGTCNCAMH